MLFSVKTIARFVGRTNAIAGKTLAELVKHCDHFGVGHIFVRNSLEQSFYVLTKVAPIMRDQVLIFCETYLEQIYLFSVYSVHSTGGIGGGVMGNWEYQEEKEMRLNRQ